MSAASPIDVVLGRNADRVRKRAGVRMAAWLVAIALHVGLVFVALRSGPSLEAWSAELALEVHEALVDDQVIELATPPAPPTPPTPADPPRATPHSHVQRAAAVAATPAPPTETPQPAQAAAVVTQDDAPVDLTGTTVVTGTATTAVGGATATTGTATDTPPVGAQLAVPNPTITSTKAPTLSRPVQLDAARWRCDWPSDALSQDIYEQAVVLRVVVAADGSVQAAQLIDDPGNGFGPAALACAKRTLFTPALNAEGAPTRALSPPIRVRFTR